MSFNSDLLDLCKLNQLNEVCNNDIDQRAIDLKMSQVANKVINAPADTMEGEQLRTTDKVM